MLKRGVAVILPVLLISAATAVPALPKRAGREVGDEVQQLDRLRKAAAAENGVSVLKTQASHFVNVNGKVEGSSTKQETVKDAASDATLASMKQQSEVHRDAPGEKLHGISRTQVDIPSLGIHDTRVEDSSTPFQQGGPEKKNLGYPWIGGETERPEQYTPTDLAEYIMRTGDEEGVALAVEGLLRQGMMTREEAIVYLQDVKAELSYLRTQQEKLRRIQELRAAISMKRKDEAMLKAQQQMKRARDEKQNVNLEKPTVLGKMHAFKPKTETAQAMKPTATASAKESTTAAPPQDRSKEAPGQSPPKATVEKRPQFPLKLTPIDLERLSEVRMSPQTQQETDVLTMLQKLKGATSVYEDYTLEEIIYWLAKDMFEHSIIKGDQSAEEALVRFATFVESEAAQNKISGEAEKKVLDIMLAALVDILREYQSKEYGPPGTGLSRHPFILNAERVLAKAPGGTARNTAIRPKEIIKKASPAEKHDEALAPAVHKS